MLDLDPTTITDLDGAREAIRCLLNMVETLSTDLSAAQKEIQYHLNNQGMSSKTSYRV